MSSTSQSTVENGRSYSHHNTRKGRGCCAKGNWSGLNIAAMVVGFVLFWPIGLVILYWNISGRDLKDLPTAIQEKWSGLFNGSLGRKNSIEDSKGQNSLFDEFQQTQYDRISEIKEEIKSRASNFRIFKSDAKRRADEVEFKDFMSSNRSQDGK